MLNNLLAIINVMESKSKLLYGMIMDVNRRITAQTGFSSVDKNFLFPDGDIHGLLVGAVIIVTLIPISYYVIRHFLRPLLQVNNELKNMLKKNNFKKIQLHSRGWTGKLAERFNEAIELIENKYDRLRVSHDNIEISNSVLIYEKDRMESVIDALDEGIIVTDCAGKIILINRNMEKLMKLSLKNVISKTMKECIDNEDILSFIERNQCYENVFAQKNLEIELNQSIVRFSSLPLLSTEESITGHIVVARDITGHRIAKKNQSEFIAHVSHELITPLNTMKSYTEMLMDDELNGRDTKTEFYNTINEEADRLARLIHNLLNISKIEMGSLKMNKDLVKTREYLEDILVSVKSLGASKKVKLESVLPDKLSSLVMEKGLLHVAILNILSNAIKYTPQGGTVTFRAEEDKDLIRIDVVDSGYGIAQEDLPHIFDKFYRSSHESIQGQTGSGLGLSLSREIIRLHNGEIEVTSKVGEGTHFTVTLPKPDSPRIKSYDKSYYSFMETNKG
jgi:signal transduction histidine kinase